MKTESINKTNNFGWNSRVHFNLTKAALKQVPVLEEFSNIILEGSKYPHRHFHYANFLNPKHCYYGENLSSLEASCSNALDVYKRTLGDSVVDWAFDDYTLSMRKIGEAIHILQDTADPVHTQKIFRSPLKISAYKKYDAIAQNCDIEKLATEKQNNAVTDNFYDLFGDTYEKSSISQNPLGTKNLKKLENMTKEYLSDAYGATIAFLKRLKNFNTMSDYNQSIAIPAEAASSKFLQNLANKSEL